jgi:DNA (cytosine-5)-methyltransferase 1
MNLVAFDQENRVNLEKKLLLEDAISDLPPVENNECNDELPYDDEPKTDFQRFIRMRKHEMLGLPSESELTEHVLYDHRPLELNPDDYERACKIPKKKGANFRSLPGVRVKEDNRVEWDPNVERVLLESGKPLVPDYAMTFVKGRSLKPFGRLWWDETVPTVVTRAEPHNQAILHPSQDRVLTIRENARLQGFPDYYKLLGPIKERYIQVGNAVAVPVARALGYALGLAFRRTCGDEPLLKLPQGFPNILELNPSEDE